MRNLLEYPIKPDEVVAAVDHAYNDYIAKQLIGGNDAFILYTIMHVFETKPELLAAVVAACDVR